LKVKSGPGFGIVTTGAWFENKQPCWDCALQLNNAKGKAEKISQ